MSNQVPTTQDMNPGTSSNLSNEAASPESQATTGPSRDDLNRFADIVALALANKKGMEVPEVEVPRRIIEYYNPYDRIKGFDDVGYFVFSGIRVYEKGKRAEFKLKEAKNMNQILHGEK